MSDRFEERVAPPTAFMSYSWDSEEHKRWTKQLATRLRGHGVDVKLDQWEAVPGDQLPHFMERAIRENDYVLIVCTPKYKHRSDNRLGGAGYEGDIIAGEILAKRNHRKYIPILREGTWETAIPTSLVGKAGVDLQGDPYAEEQYEDLLNTLLGRREVAPPVGQPPPMRRSVRDEAKRFLVHDEDASQDFEPVRIVGVIANEVGEPRLDGTHGSALYAIPFQLSRSPSCEWSDLFLRTWDHPPNFTTRHRPGIAHVQGDRLVLTRTTIEEVKEVHRETLKLVVAAVNDEIEKAVHTRRQQREAEELKRHQHQKNIHKIADEIDFD